MVCGYCLVRFYIRIDNIDNKIQYFLKKLCEYIPYCISVSIIDCFAARQNLQHVFCTIWIWTILHCAMCIVNRALYCKDVKMYVNSLQKKMKLKRMKDRMKIDKIKWNFLLVIYLESIHEFCIELSIFLNSPSPPSIPFK